MRDLIIVLGIFVLCALIMRRAWIGVLVWTWISLLTPHKEAFGFSVSLRLNLVVVLITLIAVFVSKDAKKWPSGAPAWLFVVFIIWTSLAVAVSPDPTESFVFWNDFIIKMAVHIVLAMLLINSKHRITALVWVIAISLGYHAVKIALVTLKSGFVIGRLDGNFGPKDTMIMDRNHFALAMLMLCPLLMFFVRQAKARWVRICCFLGIGTALIAVVGSQSRGGAATMIVMLSYLLLKSKRKILFSSILGVLALVAVNFAPDSIKERLSTIAEQTEEADLGDEKELDESFCLRLAVWQIGYDMTLASPVFGNGVRSIQNHDIAGNYTSENHVCSDSPKYGPRAAHNIYIEVMTDSGFVGLGLFIAILITTWLSLRRTIKLSKGDKRLEWARDLAAMLQVSIIGYAVGGMLLSMAYYDGYFLLIATAVCLNRWVREQRGLAEPRRMLPGVFKESARTRRPSTSRVKSSQGNRGNVN